MIPLITHKSVNWIDGMKLNQQHFLQQENAWNDALRDVLASGLTPFSYGLLPQSPVAPKSLDMSVQSDSDGQVAIWVTGCRAVTAGGGRIEITDQTPVSFRTRYESLKQEFGLTAGKDTDFDIVLRVDPFARVPFGDPSLEELPPRQPFTIPTYSIAVIPSAQLNRQQTLSHLLPVGRLVFEQQQWIQADDYIPPCLTVGSHTTLIYWHQRFGELLLELEQHALRVNQKALIKNQHVALADNTSQLIAGLLMSLASGWSRYRSMLLHQSPVYLIDWLLQLIQSLRIRLMLLSPTAREEVLDYWGEWADNTAGHLEKRITTLAGADYVHSDIAPLLGQLDEFFRMLTTLMQKLAQLEFIGKRKGGSVMVSASAPSKYGNSILADQTGNRKTNY